jgi:hypothetical protein
MRSNLILSIILATVIANPVVRRANEAENSGGLVDLKADVAENEKAGEGIPIAGEELSDLKLQDKIKEILALKKKTGKLSKDVDVKKVLKLLKKQLNLKKATSISNGELLSILDKIIGVELKAEGEKIDLGSEAKGEEAATATATAEGSTE